MIVTPVPFRRRFSAATPGATSGLFRARITKRMQETECEHCGIPLYVGDHVITTVDGRTTCSQHCAKGGN